MKCEDSTPGILENKSVVIITSSFAFPRSISISSCSSTTCRYAGINNDDNISYRTVNPATCVNNLLSNQIVSPVCHNGNINNNIICIALYTEVL